MKIDRKEIAKIIAEKGATKSCHRCGHTKFSVLGGYSNLSLQDDIGTGIVLGGPSVPVAVLACDNCGAIILHALGALGLLPKDKEGESNE